MRESPGPGLPAKGPHPLGDGCSPVTLTVFLPAPQEARRRPLPSTAGSKVSHQPWKGGRFTLSNRLFPACGPSLPEATRAPADSEPHRSLLGKAPPPQLACCLQGQASLWLQLPEPPSARLFPKGWQEQDPTCREAHQELPACHGLCPLRTKPLTGEMPARGSRGAVPTAPALG